jgi:hypothetical protein
MPSNTTVPNPGTPIEYQNPGTVSAVLDAEVVGTDQVSSAQLTREFVVPVESITGQSSLTTITDLLSLILRELKKISILLQQDQVPEGIGQADELVDEPPAEEIITEGLEEF